METGDRLATRWASVEFTPWAVRPWYRLCGSDADNPMMMSEKKMPMESTCAELTNVVLIPEPTPRCSAGRLFITAARFGEPNEAMASPMKNSRTAKTQ